MNYLYQQAIKNKIPEKYAEEIGAFRTEAVFVRNPKLTQLRAKEVMERIMPLPALEWKKNGVDAVAKK